MADPPDAERRHEAKPADPSASALVPARDRDLEDQSDPLSSSPSTPQSVPSDDRAVEGAVLPAGATEGSRLAVTPIRTVRRRRVEPRTVEAVPAVDVEAQPPQRLERAVPPAVRRDRPLNDALSTLFTAALVGLVAVVLLSELGPGAITGSAPGTANEAGLSTELQVSADDGWVTVPGQFETASIVGTGTIRIRIGGEVFTVPAGQTVQATPPPGEGVSVRVVRAPATARIRVRQR